MTSPVPTKSFKKSRAALAALLHSPLQLAALLFTAAMVGGVTYGAWVVSGAGNGYAKASSSQTLTLADASASTTAQLYPGGTGDVILKVSNPNAFPVTITDVVSAGSPTSDKGAGCTAATGVSLTAQHSLSAVVAANAVGTVVTLTGAAAMAGTSDTSCQGAIFTLPVTVTASS